MGKMLAEFRKASNDFKRTIEDELEAEKSRESQATAIPAPDVPAAVTDVTATDVTASAVSATDATTAGVPEAAGVPEVAPAPPPAFEGAETSGTPESEPRVERPAEAVVSRGRSDES
jgi:sec-independent protein translocase protein TatB